MNKIPIHSVIMAGGMGKRFWPVSRKNFPKQIMDVDGNGPMIKQTYDRILQFTKAENIWIVTNENQKKLIKPILPEIPEDHYVIEPSGKNTAPCIGLAAIHILEEDENAIMGVFPADHWIGDTEKFFEDVKLGYEQVVKHNCLLTFGIKPTFPSTGYGYIQFDIAISEKNGRAHSVKTFAEKPHPELAEKFIKSGDFLWNSGMFMWKAKTIHEEMAVLMPELYHTLERIRRCGCTENLWKTIRSQSIDYGIMEHSERVWVVISSFSWSDLGSWDAMYDQLEKDENNNVTNAESIFIQSKNNLVHSQRKKTVIFGLDDIIVVNTDDVTMVIPRGQSQAVKTIVEELEKKDKKEYL